MIKLDIERTNTDMRNSGFATAPRKTNNNNRMLVNIVVIVIVLSSLGFGGYFYYKLRTLQRNASGDAAKAEAQDLLSKVAKIYLIPTGEEPTIATVTDPNALKGQAFFSESQKGDKVLIFTKAGKAVLYRPSINKIIETAPINNTNDQTTTPPPTPTSGPLKDKTF